jgi:hypothetical protein
MKTYSSQEVCKQAGITYRQLEFWCIKGYLTPLDGRKGSGVPFTFDGEQLRRAYWLAALVRCGVGVKQAANPKAVAALRTTLKRVEGVLV